MSDIEHYDLVIIGGGLVGASLASALRDVDMRIALVDARMPDPRDPRLFALNDSSCAMLKRLGVWSALAQHASPIHQVHVSRQGCFGAVRMHREEVSLSSLGHVIPACQIESVLNAMLAEQKNVTIYRPAELRTLTQDPSSVDTMVTLCVAMHDENITLTTPRVIGADGTVSTVRTALDIVTETIDYHQQAIVTRTRLQRSHAQVAYERFTANGAIAMLPLPGEECATIWTTDQDHAEQLMALTEQAFTAALQAEFGYRLGRLMGIAKRHHFPLKMVRAREHVRGGVMLLGNASHTLHPIAAQGFNLALYEVAVIAEALQSAHPIHWTEIHEKMASQMRASVTVSHQLAAIFNHSSLLMRCLLPFGMVGFDKMTALKRIFINKLMGRSGRVPKWLMYDGVA